MAGTESSTGKLYPKLDFPTRNSSLSQRPSADVIPLRPLLSRGTDANLEAALTNGTRESSHWRRLFDKYDTDGDGVISLSELRGLIESREYDRDIPDNVVRQIMAMSDLNNSGSLNYEEFVRMAHNRQLRALFGHLLQRYINSIVPPRAPDPDVDVVDGAYSEAYSCWPPPLWILLISVVELLLFVVDASVDHTDATGPAAKALIYNHRKRHEAWRFVTYMLVHVEWTHLFMNLLVQMFLGLILELVHGWRVAVIYVAGVIAGSLGTSIIQPTVHLAGASAGVFALMTAHIATIIMNWSEKFYPIWQLLTFVMLTCVTVGQTIHDTYVLRRDTSTSLVAHSAGALAGLLAGLGVLRNLNVRSWEKKLWWMAVVTYCILMCIAVLLNIFWTSHFSIS